MTMSSTMLDNKKIFITLYISTLVIAAVLRFAGIGSIPLTDLESHNAVQALGMLSDRNSAISGEPIYVIYTSVLFWIFGATEVSARLLPAIAGTLIVLTPLFLRRETANSTILLLTAFFAIDPLLVGLSRFASADAYSILMLLCIAGFLFNQKYIFAGIALGLGLLSSELFWIGISVVIIAMVFLRFNRIKRSENLLLSSFGYLSRKHWIQFIFAAGVTFFVIGSGFMVYPTCWQAAVKTLAAFFGGFSTPAVLPLKAHLAGILGYAVFPLFIGLLTLVIQVIRRDNSWYQLWIIAATAFLFSLVYASRNVYLVILVTIPIWCYITFNIYKTVQFDENDRVPYLIGTLVIITLILFTYSNLRSLFSASYQIYPTEIQIAALIGGVVLIGLTMVLIVWGWGFQLGTNLLYSAFGSVLLVYSLASTFGVTGYKDSYTSEMTARNATAVDMDLISSTIQDISERQFLSNTGVEIELIDTQDPSLSWVLRDFEIITRSKINPNTDTPIIITDNNTQVEASLGYRGQDFVWTRIPDWLSMTGGDYINWLITRAAKYQDKGLILWVRSDLFAE